MLMPIPRLISPRVAPLVIACAMQGDEVAEEVVRHGGEELADLAAIVIERVRAAEEGSWAINFEMLPVALAGSILEKVPRARLHSGRSLIGVIPTPRFRPDPSTRSRAPYGARARGDESSSLRQDAKAR